MKTVAALSCGCRWYRPDISGIQRGIALEKRQGHPLSGGAAAEVKPKGLVAGNSHFAASPLLAEGRHPEFESRVPRRGNAEAYRQSAFFRWHTTKAVLGLASISGMDIQWEYSKKSGPPIPKCWMSLRFPGHRLSLRLCQKRGGGGKAPFLKNRDFSSKASHSGRKPGAGKAWLPFTGSFSRRKSHGCGFLSYCAAKWEKKYTYKNKKAH